LRRKPISVFPRFFPCAHSSVRLAAIADAEDLDGVIASLTEDDTPVTDAEAVPGRIEALKLLDIACIGFEKPGQGHEQPQCGIAVNGSDVGTGLV
jgi:hypothetical protein